MDNLVRGQGSAELEYSKIEEKLKISQRHCEELKHTIRGWIDRDRRGKALYEKVCKEKSKMECEKNEIISGLNEQINGLKKRNMESELLLRVYQDKFKDLNARVVKMDEEVKNLKAAQVNKFEGLAPRVVKVENIAHAVVAEEGAIVKFQDSQGVILGNSHTQEGRNSDAGTSKKEAFESTKLVEKLQSSQRQCEELKHKISGWKVLYEKVCEDKSEMESEKNEIIFELNQQINGLKRKNMETELLLTVYQDKFKGLNARVMKMEEEVKNLKAARVNKNLFESLAPRVVKVENIAHIVVAEEGANVKFQDYEDKKGIFRKNHTQERRNGDVGASKKGIPVVDEEGDGDDDKKKRKRALMGPSKIRSCKVPGCKADITGKRKYHHLKGTCGFHAKADVVLFADVEQRFCQGCNRFHELSEFDEGRRNCRTNLAYKSRYNRRRTSDFHKFLDDEGVDGDNEKRKGALIGPFNTWSCKVPGCNADITDEKLFTHYRNKVCGFHTKADAVLIADVEQRFCRNCTRFHELSEFDETKRACRTSLAKRNHDRRRLRSEKRQ